MSIHPPHEALKPRAVAWFAQLRDRICAEFEAIEDLAGPNPGRFVRTAWDRPGGGGGVMSVIRGQVFEKAGVNVSVVEGEFSEDFARRIPGTEVGAKFWAAGISLVAHPRSPKLPAVHMNTRMIVTAKGWFGGGGDLTPLQPGTAEAAEDAAEFHAAYRAACDRHGADYYRKLQRMVRRIFLSAAPQGAARRWRHLLRLSGFGRRGGGFRLHPRCRRGFPLRLPAHRPAALRRALHGGGARGATHPPRPLRGVQPALRPRHYVRAENRRQHRGDPHVHAAGSEVAVAFTA